MTTETNPGTALTPSEDDLATLKGELAKIGSGTLDLPSLLAKLATLEDGDHVRAVPVPKPLTDDQRAALDRLPDVFGKTVVTTDRLLTDDELAAIVDERQTIDKILKALDTRKSDSIREVLANHLDATLTPATAASARTDRNGHYAVKQEVSVPGTEFKVQRTVSGGKPRLSIDHVEALHASGQIDRATYLALTRKPDLPRVLDEEGVSKAVKKDPRLFFLLASVAEPTPPTTTIKVARDS